jgi:hypothetical protein
LGTQVIVLGSAEGQIASRQHRAIERGSAYDPSLETSDPYEDQGGYGSYRQGNAAGEPLRLQGADPSQQSLTADPYGRPVGRYAPYAPYPVAPRGAPYGYGGYYPGYPDN